MNNFPEGQGVSPINGPANSMTNADLTGQWAIYRDWGVNAFPITKATAELFYLKRGWVPSQIKRSDVLAVMPDKESAEALRDAIAGADGEFNRRKMAAQQEASARIQSAAEARDKAVARLIAKAVANPERMG